MAINLLDIILCKYTKVKTSTILAGIDKNKNNIKKIKNKTRTFLKRLIIRESCTYNFTLP